MNEREGRKREIERESERARERESERAGERVHVSARERGQQQEHRRLNLSFCSKLSSFMQYDDVTYVDDDVKHA